MQGIVGTIPSSALAFLTLYLQLLGMSDFHASVCTALFLAGQARHTTFLEELMFNLSSTHTSARETCGRGLVS